MKIAILSPFYPYRGGIAQFSSMLYKQFETENHTVKAFNFSRLYPDFLFPGKSQYVENEEEELLRTETTRILNSCNPISYFRTVDAIKEFCPDLLIISYWMSFFVPAYAHIANRLKKHTRVIALVHNAIPHESHFFDKPLFRLFLKQCHAAVVMSNNVFSDIKKLLPETKLIEIQHPLYDHYGQLIDRLEAHRKLGLNTTKKVLLFFGLIRDYKGLDLLIAAMPRLKKDFHLLIAGECYGSSEKYLSMIQERHLENDVTFMNRFIPDKQVSAIFSASDCLVLPYKSATQSGVVGIAYSFNLPIIATPVGNFESIIKNSNTGIVTDEISSESIALAVENMFSIPKKYKIFRESIKFEKEALSWNNFSNIFIKFAKRM